jgi:hypothetical protein
MFDEMPAAKSPKEPSFDQQLRWFVGLRSRILNSTRETARDWREGSVFGPICRFSLNCPLGQKTKALTIGSFEGEGKGGKGEGEGMKRKYFQKTYGNEDILSGKP